MTNSNNHRFVFHALLVCILFAGFNLQAKESTENPSVAVTELLFELLVVEDSLETSIALNKLQENWHDSLIAPLLEVMNFSRTADKYQLINQTLQELTGQSFDQSNDWYFWLWNQSIQPVAGYDDFKAALYRNIDPLFEKYFRQRGEQAKIRLDEIRWGGVLQDGIPPLRNPEMISASRANYLNDDDVVFGIKLNGDARAYPKRILAWHEMFTDTIGGVDIAGVYCTLCGTVIPFRTEHKGTKHNLGTSGFLYRSNKLMYDQATQSLWSTTRGVPVVGPLVDQGIELEHEGVVTTTWGEWKRRHPKTLVLSLKTGHRRDYGEGVAYQDYFNNDRLMFNTPFADDRLANKQEVLALRFPAAPDQQLAIDTEFLSSNPVYQDKIGQQNFVVFTDQTGANRVYDSGNIQFTAFDGDSTVTDKQGRKWLLSEESLISNDKTTLARLPYRRAFWFGWHAAFPETKLIK